MPGIKHNLGDTLLHDNNLSATNDGGVSVSWANDAATFTVDATVIRTTGNQTLAGEKTFSGDVIVSGDLTVSGTTTYVNTTELQIGDNIITLNADETGTPSENAGFEVERGTSANVSIVWDETNDRWTVGVEDMVAANFIGDLTGDVTGTVSDISNHDTADLAEGSNLYWTVARGQSMFDTRLATKDTADLAEGSNLYWTTARGESMFDTKMAAADTADLAEGTNLYYTDARADARIAAASTDDLSEGSNLYYTDERVDDRVGALVVGGTNITVTYDDVGGTLTLDVDASGGADLTNNDTDDLSEGSTNLYYTDARADARIAAADTDDLSEGSTNLYYTDSRADARIAAASITDLSDADQAVATTDSPTFAALTISGDLTINGTTTTVSTTNLEVEDSLIELASENNAADTLDIGLFGEYSDDGGTTVRYTGLFRDASTEMWHLFHKLEDKPTTTVDIDGTNYNYEGAPVLSANISGNLTGGVTGNVAGNLTGNVSGNVTGNVTGDVTGNVTGNADTATALETARDIGGVSFDGSANINLPGVNTAGNQDTTGNAATATALETTRTIAGVDFDGTENIAISIANLSDVSGIIDSDTMTGATSTNVASAESVKAYVDAQVSVLDLDISDGTNTIAIDDDETFSILGTANQITTVASDNQIAISLPVDVDITTSLTVANVDISGQTITSYDSDELQNPDLILKGQGTGRLVGSMNNIGFGPGIENLGSDTSNVSVTTYSPNMELAHNSIMYKSGANGIGINAIRGRLSGENPTFLASGDEILAVRGLAQDDIGGYNTTGEMTFNTTEAHATSARGTKFVLETTANGASSSSPSLEVQGTTTTFLGTHTITSDTDTSMTVAANGTGTLTVDAGTIALTSDNSITINNTLAHASGELTLSGNSTSDVVTATRLDVSAGMKVNVTAVSANYTALATDHLVTVTDTTAAITITLPSAATVEAGHVIIVKDSSGGSFAENITIDPASTETIDGNATIDISTAWGVLHLVSNGSDWLAM